MEKDPDRHVQEICNRSADTQQCPPFRYAKYVYEIKAVGKSEGARPTLSFWLDESARVSSFPQKMEYVC